MLDDELTQLQSELKSLEVENTQKRSQLHSLELELERLKLESESHGESKQNKDDSFTDFTG
jgi:chromosome segregation ATPase